MQLKYIINELCLERLFIRNLPNIEVNKDFVSLSIKEFNKIYNRIKSQIRVPKNINKFYNNIIQLWKMYMENLYLMDCLTNKFQPIYPKKIKVLSDFLKFHYLLNLVIYHYTKYEKSIIKKILNKIKEIDSIIYSLFTSVKDTDYELLPLTTEGYFLYTILLKNEKLIKKFQNTLLNQKNSKENITINVNINTLEYKLLLLNIIEQIWKESKLLQLDISFFYIIGKYYNKYSILEIIKHLNSVSNKLENTFKFNIPKYKQSYNSCGVACLMNILKTYLPEISLNKKLEKELLKKVNVGSYEGNLTPLLVKIAKEEYDIDGYMFIDYNDYMNKIKKIIKNNPSIKAPVNTFINSIKRIKYEDRKSFKFEELVNLLKEGHMISYVGEIKGIKHYKLIYGYDTEKRELFVYDPLGYILKIHKNNIDKKMKNSLSFWGMIFKPKDKQVIKQLEKQIEKIKNILENKNFYTINKKCKN